MRDRIYAVIYTTMLTAGIIVINYTVPQNADNALQSTLTALNAVSRFAPIQTAAHKPEVHVLLG